jgi:hypothetical protein
VRAFKSVWGQQIFQALLVAARPVLFIFFLVARMLESMSIATNGRAFVKVKGVLQAGYKHKF